MIGKLLKWFWKGNADENLEQKEYESMSVELFVSSFVSEIYTHELLSLFSSLISSYLS